MTTLMPTSDYDVDKVVSGSETFPITFLIFALE